MTNIVPPLKAGDALLRDYTHTERTLLANMHHMSRYDDLSADPQAVIDEHKAFVDAYDTSQEIDRRIWLQVEMLDAVFHHAVKLGCGSTKNFKDAFTAQELFMETVNS